MNPVRRILAIIAIAAFSLAILLEEEAPVEEASIEIITYEQLSNEQPKGTAQPDTRNDVIRVHYFVKIGDTFSEILANWSVPYQTALKLAEADAEALKLDTIRPGDHLELYIEPNTKALSKLIYHESLVEHAIYEITNQGDYSYRFIEEPGEWREKLVTGVVEGSFSLSAHRLGLNTNQIANITRVLKDKLDFSRDLRAGDFFSVLIDQQFIGNHLTGNAEIQAVSFKLRGKEIAAFLADDGRFYDREGNSLEQAFDRYPVDKKYRRVTSHFNPRRKHPVTGRITPHNGTDFATPVGAPVYSTGDGKVTMVRNHQYAGKYLVVEHNSVYKTRYLHLDQFLVKKGDQVKRGQMIARAGATGRITGPHLHFEVLVRNRPVDAMKADLPMASSISEANKEAFESKISRFDSQVKALVNQ